MTKIKLACNSKEGHTSDQDRKVDIYGIIGYPEIGYNIFNLNIDFIMEVRFLAGGINIDAPKFITEYSVVSRKIVILLFIIAELNCIKIMSFELQNFYRNTPYQEKILFKVGI